VSYEHTMIALRIHLQELQSLKKLIAEGQFRNMSDAVRETAKIGMRMLEYKKLLEDPERAHEFHAKMKEIIKNDEIFHWLETLSIDQVDAFHQALVMEKDKRYRMQKLI